MKNKKNIIAIISAVVLVIAAVVAIIVFRKEIGDFLAGLKNKLPCGKKQFTSEEIEDFADI